MPLCCNSVQVQNLSRDEKSGREGYLGHQWAGDSDTVAKLVQGIFEHGQSPSSPMHCAQVTQNEVENLWIESRTSNAPQLFYAVLSFQLFTDTWKPLPTSFSVQYPFKSGLRFTWWEAYIFVKIGIIIREACKIFVTLSKMSMRIQQQISSSDGAVIVKISKLSSCTHNYWTIFVINVNMF